MVTIKIQQSNISTPPVYATCIGDNGLTGDEHVVIGTQFARLNGLDPDVETVFEIFPKNIPILSSVIAEPCKEEDWELLVIFIVEIFVSRVITSFSAQELNVDQIQSELLNK